MSPEARAHKDKYPFCRHSSLTTIDRKAATTRKLQAEIEAQRRASLSFPRRVLSAIIRGGLGSMSRREFSKQTKRDAIKRSGMLCEAVGTMYGLDAGKRCNAPLSHGVEYDHIVLDANSKDNSLENCAAVCIKCHKHKTAKHDIPMAAKTVRMQDKANGIRRQSASIAKRPKSPKPVREQLELPRRSLYRSADA